MLRILHSVAAVVLSALPLHADPLPPGEYMLGSAFWPQNMHWHYVTLRIDGEDMTVELSNPVMMNDTVCLETGVCSYLVDVATAQIAGDGSVLGLSNIDIFADLTDDVWSPRVPVQDYAQPLLGALQDSTVLETDTGFTLTTTAGPLEFFHTDAEARAIIRAYPQALSVSIRELGACEVRAIATLLARDDLSPAEETFRTALRGLAHEWRLETQRAELNPLMGELDPANEEAWERLTVRSMLPRFLSIAPGGPMAPDAIDIMWDDFGIGVFRNNRAAFDAEVAVYGDVLIPLAAFRAHLDTTAVPITAQNACNDPSFGFIAAQAG